MKFITTLTLIVTMTVILSACGSRKDQREREEVAAAQQADQAAATMSPEEVQQTTADWSPQHRRITERMVSKYGQPDESTSDMLIWNNNGPWIRTVVKKDDMNKPLLQTASMKVPPEKLGEVALFNRSITVDANNNMVTSSSSSEELNFLAMNLTKRIVDGRMSPMEARRQYSEISNVTERTSLMDSLKFQRGEESLEAEEVQEEEAQ